MIFAASDANLRYSASALDLAIVFCFSEDQLIHLEPRKRQRPMVDLLVMEEPIQSTSENPTKLRDNFDEMYRHRSGAPVI